MIFSAARSAFGQLFDPAVRGVLLKVLGLTLLALAILWFGLKELFDWLALPWIDQLLSGLPAWAGWLGPLAAILAGIGLAIGLALLVAPVTAMLAGYFLDDVAEEFERRNYPGDPPGRALPTGRSLVLSAKFFGVTVVCNLVALVLLLVPFVNLGAFFVINGYLLGREYFEFTAMRFLPEAEAKAMRRANAGTVFVAGLVIAAFVAVPLLNLLAPLFSAAMMLNIYKALEKRRATVPPVSRQPL